jgi:pimeloyl-ACP methyl ester carboxylesterase
VREITWSDTPPRGRRTFDDMADELRQGLAGAGIGTPYVLVGHSIGGIIARRFAVRYGGEVAGIVLVDSSHEDQARRRRADGWWRGAPRTLVRAKNS